jgi:hypothetical protein
MKLWGLELGYQGKEKGSNIFVNTFALMQTILEQELEIRLNLSYEIKIDKFKFKCCKMLVSEQLLVMQYKYQ